MISKIALALLIVLASPIVLAGVSINEFELNPNGIPDLELVEIYNDGESLSLDGWWLEDRDGNMFFFPPVIVDDFYVIDGFSNDLVNANESIFLYDENGSLVDSALFFGDSSNDERTWQRVPDGIGEFVFEEGTLGFPNLPILIENKTINKECVSESESVSLMAQVSGFCIEEVIFWVEGLGNFSGIKIGDNYSYTIPAFNLSDGSVDWSVYAVDCFNRTEKNGDESFFVNEGTKLEVDPSDPNGLNGWYVSEPDFSLENDDADNIWYRWDGGTDFIFTSAFGLENLPGAIFNGTIWAAGIHDLNWFSDVCTYENDYNESLQSKTLKVDLTSPALKDLMPLDESTIYTSDVYVYAYIDEIYQGNSGINLSSIIMEIDDVEVAANVSPEDDLDASVSFMASLDEGEHTVYVYAEDNSGRWGYAMWSFFVDIPPEFDINIVSPLDGIYESKRVLFNISIEDEGTPVEVDSIEYFNYNDKHPRWKRLCRNCEEYVRKGNVNEGQNNITIRASADGIVKEDNISLFVDSKKPIVHAILPKKNGVTNGDDFWISYSEDNLEKIELFFNGSSVLNCTSGKRQECSALVDLSGHDGESIEYWFEVSDSINTVITKKTIVKVDTTSPTLTINMPQNETYGRKVPFNLSVSEEVDIEYMDLWDENPKWKKLCGDCDEYGLERAKAKNFRKGIHEIVVRATDEAGNTDEASVGFLVDY